jgi:hypothetical protein
MRTSLSCDRALGQRAVGSDEAELAAGGGGDASLRQDMAQRQPINRYISYAALRVDQVPCNQRSRSYYCNCGLQQPANPYRRGCSPSPAAHATPTDRDRINLIDWAATRRMTMMTMNASRVGQATQVAYDRSQMYAFISTLFILSQFYFKF